MEKKEGGLNKKDGLVNGFGGPAKTQGIINGNAIVPPTPKKKGKWDKIFVAFLVAIILAAGIGGIVASVHLKNIVNWDNESKISDIDVDEVTNSAVNITSFGLKQVDGFFNFYIKFAGEFSKGDIRNTAYIFVDDDSNPKTGYNTLYIGAEYVIKIWGENGRVGGNIYRFNGTSTDSWSWVSVGLVYVESKNPNEIQGYVETTFQNTAKFLLFSQSEYSQDITPVISLSQPSLCVVQRGLANDTLEIRLTPLTTIINVGSITLEKYGNITTSRIPQSVGSISSPTKFYVHITPEENYTGGAKLWIERVESNGTVTIMGDGFRKYYGTPNRIDIDGIFDDWNTLAPPVSQKDEAENPNIDITEYSAYNDENAYFYVGVDGVMLKGSLAPEAIPTGTSGEGLGVEIIKKPYDYAEITYWTTDGNKHVVKVYGYNGIVTRIEGDNVATKDISVAVGKNHGYGALEVGIENAGNITRYAIRMTDWNGESDYISAHYLPRSDDNRTTPPDIYAPEFNQILPIFLIIVAIPIIRKRRK